MTPPRLATWRGCINPRHSIRLRLCDRRPACVPRLFFLVRNSLEHERFLPYLYAYLGSTQIRRDPS